MISHMILPNLPAHLKKNSCEIINNKNNNNNEVPESIAKGVFTCRICSTAHITWFEFSRHFLKHHGVEPKILLQYKCVPCDLLFQTKEVYLEHINRKCPSAKNKAAQGLICPRAAAHGHNCPISSPKSPPKCSSIKPNHTPTLSPKISASPSLYSSHLCLDICYFLFFVNLSFPFFCLCYQQPL